MCYYYYYYYNKAYILVAVKLEKMETDVVEGSFRFCILHLFLLYIIHVGRERSAGIFPTLIQSLSICMLFIVSEYLDHQKVNKFIKEQFRQTFNSAFAPTNLTQTFILRDVFKTKSDFFTTIISSRNILYDLYLKGGFVFNKSVCYRGCRRQHVPQMHSQTPLPVKLGAHVYTTV